MEEGQRHFRAANVSDADFSLNPCCNGRGSKTRKARPSIFSAIVLIVVVMEEGQRRKTLVPSGRYRSLNPCCNGRGSKTGGANDQVSFGLMVLILVVMEEGQRRLPRSSGPCGKSVLILVVMEEGQRHKGNFGGGANDQVS